MIAVGWLNGFHLVVSLIIYAADEFGELVIRNESNEEV